MMQQKQDFSVFVGSCDSGEMIVLGRVKCNYSRYIMAFYVAFILWEFFRNCMGGLGSGHDWGTMRSDRTSWESGKWAVGICHSDKVDKSQI